MKTFLCICLLLGLTSFYAQSQTAKWDSTIRAGRFQTQVDIFQSYPNSSDDIIFLGNSITYRVNWNELLGIPQARNRGISGDNTFGVLERMNEVIEGKPARIFILIGINDLGKNIPVEVILNNYKRIIHTIKAGSPLTKIYFQTLLPFNNKLWQKSNLFNKDIEIKIINQELKKIAKTEKITLIDLYPNFLDSEGQLKETLTEDGVHLNAEGYKVWKGILIPYLK